MIRFLLPLLVCTALAIAQEHDAAPDAPTAHSGTEVSNPSAESNLPPSAPVITIKGLCPSSGSGEKAEAEKSAPDCKTVVTRAEFEKLVDLLQVPPPAKKQFATQYANALVMVSEARKRGLDHGTRFEELLKVARLQVLSRELARELQEQSAKISDKDIDNYYHQHLNAYDEATLERLYIPRAQQSEPFKAGESEADRKKKQDQSEATMKKEADELHSRAASGEDFTKLQVEAYKFANYKATPPPVKMDKVRRGSLPPAQSATVLAMKPGEVSQLFTDPGGYFVYKLVQKGTIPLDVVSDEIRSLLQKEKLQSATEAIEKSATPSLNDDYFASTAPAPANQGIRPSLNPSGGPSNGPR